MARGITEIKRYVLGRIPGDASALHPRSAFASSKSLTLIALIPRPTRVFTLKPICLGVPSSLGTPDACVKWQNPSELVDPPRAPHSEGSGAPRKS